MIAQSELEAMRECARIAEPGGRYRQDVPRLIAEIEHLREALRQVEPKCRQLVGTSTSNNHIAVLDECRICHAQFSSREPTREQRHRQECPFACLKK